VYQLSSDTSVSEPNFVSEIVRLFRSVFGSDIPSELLDPAFLHWKFFESRPGGHESRSYMIRQDGVIVAHACIWPMAFRTPTGVINCVHVLDWAASPYAAGAGVALYRELIQMADAAFVIGGTAQARRLLPKLGFQQYGTMRYYARPVRPLYQFAARPKRSFCREMARLARNTLWALPPFKDAGTRWSAMPILKAGPWLDELAQTPLGNSASPGIRSSALVNYFLACPAGRCRLYSIAFDGSACGYFLLNEVRGQTRIIDLFVQSPKIANWEAAYRLAFRSALALPGTCEVVAATPLLWLAAIFRHCGMRERSARPVLLYDPKGLLYAVPPLHFQMTDSDAFFLYSPSFPFLT
jgi:hypothetical protein